MAKRTEEFISRGVTPSGPDSVAEHVHTVFLAPTELSLLGLAPLLSECLLKFFNRVLLVEILVVDQGPHELVGERRVRRCRVEVPSGCPFTSFISATVLSHLPSTEWQG